MPYSLSPMPYVIMPSMSTTRHRTGFTLVEMLVVMAIIGILAGIIVTYAFQARKRAQQTFCLNNIRQLGMTHLGVGSGKEIMDCPLGATYAINRYAKHQSEATNNPAGIVMLFESDGATEGGPPDVYPVHNGGSNYVFWDGHAKWNKEVPKFRP